MPVIEDARISIYQGDCRDVLPTLPADSIQCCVTSPPYWGLRDYGLPPSVWGGDPACEHEWISNNRKLHTGSSASEKALSNRGAFHGEQETTDRVCLLCGAWRGCLGLEPTPELYVEHLVEVMREVRRVLREDATVFLNLGDSYQDKQLVGIPWRVAFALQADGWYLRSDIIWSKPNCMPESVTDRPTKAHEYLFLLTKSARYFYDHEAVKEPAMRAGDLPGGGFHYAPDDVNDQRTRAGLVENGKRPVAPTRNLRTVWTISTKPYSGAHFATFPPALVEPCILAGSAVGDVVLDPFAGSGTVGEVCVTHRRRFVGVELSPEYIGLIQERTNGVQPRLL